jgi:hypothetical protein
MGLPTKEGEQKAIFDYEKILFDAVLVNEGRIRSIIKKLSI